MYEGITELAQNKGNFLEIKTKKPKPKKHQNPKNQAHKKTKTPKPVNLELDFVLELIWGLIGNVGHIHDRWQLEHRA